MILFGLCLIYLAAIVICTALLGWIGFVSVLAFIVGFELIGMRRLE